MGCIEKSLSKLKHVSLCLETPFGKREQLKVLNFNILKFGHICSSIQKSTFLFLL